MAEPNEVFGPLRHEGIIEDAAEQTLRLWLPTYLEQARQQAEHGKIAPIKSWGVASEFARFPEQQLPALIIESSGTTSTPEKTGDGNYRATYALSVAVELIAANGAEARRIAEIYGAAILGTMLQRRSLGLKWLSVTDWLGVQKGAIGVQERRTRIALEQVFAVQLDYVVNAFAGPGTDEVPDPVPTEWPAVDSAVIEVERQPL
jgi:hypothetical protein